MELVLHYKSYLDKGLTVCMNLVLMQSQDHAAGAAVSPQLNTITYVLS
jgi:hypothetical protein